MSKNQNKQTNSWNKSGTFSSYDEANEERKILQNDETLQVKVRRRHSSESFTVHFRKNPALLEKQKKKEKKPKKKREQKKK